MSKMSNFALELESFTQAAAGLSPAQALALSELYFSDDNERAYAMSLYNPQQFSNKSYSLILSELSCAGMR